jgi:hypothetical protein
MHFTDRQYWIGVYDVPPGIGRGAELVLKGCMERSPTSRWTISMVDDVAWGVGWGPDDTSAPVEAGFVGQNCSLHHALNSKLSALGYLLRT